MGDGVENDIVVETVGGCKGRVVGDGGETVKR